MDALKISIILLLSSPTILTLNSPSIYTFEDDYVFQSETPPFVYSMDHIGIARYIVHRAVWTSVATISTDDRIKGYPFSNIASMSDGTIKKSTGNPYFYISPLDFSALDLEKDSRCTISVTLAQTSFCQSKLYDPEDPRCARVMLTGHMIHLPNNTAEYEFAKDALFTRHPAMIDFPKDHGFYIAKLNIENILLLDYFGGAKDLNVKDYFAYNVTKT